MTTVNKKYIVYPGTVKSTSDGQRHYLNAARLIDLYRVNPAECIIAKANDTWYRGYDPEYLKSLTKLYPREDGNYTLPEGK